LWWVRAFVLRSNGEITVDSKKNVGTKFCVKIPLATLVADDTTIGPGETSDGN
jgi:chemotaxis protein histidine kinase CheA